MPSNKFRSIWISDIHLGTRACKTAFLLDFLKNHDCETLYLIGDIIDLWRMESSLYWPQTHNDVVRRILSKARNGTKIVYITGNHDEKLRDFAPTGFGNIELRNRAIHTTVSGKKFLVLHGDAFDGITMYHKWLARIGDNAYDLLVKINTIYNWVRRKLGKDYWSLSRYLKLRAKSAANFINNYEEAVSNYAKQNNYDGVISGHIHHAEYRNINGIEYWNDGDWCESCTALLEYYDGTFELIEWDPNKSNTKILDRKKY